MKISDTTIMISEGVKVRDVVTTINELQSKEKAIEKELVELKEAIIELLGSSDNWEEQAENSTRGSIKVLYKKYNEFQSIFDIICNSDIHFRVPEILVNTLTELSRMGEIVNNEESTESDLVEDIHYLNKIDCVDPNKNEVSDVKENEEDDEEKYVEGKIEYIE